MYNYLNDAMNMEFSCAEQYRLCDSSKINCRDRATICGKCYQDPDAVSRKLYEDMRDKFNQVFKQELVVGGNRNQWYLKFDDKIDHELSTDYIGPSRAWALEYLNGNSEEKAKVIGEFLLISRTIGGHVFWPAHRAKGKNTINQVKGGRGMLDRIDITLAELKNFYAKPKYEDTGKAFYYEPLFRAFQRYQWFFKIFETFDNYIEKMKLGMFLQNGEIISLMDSDLENNHIVPLSEETKFQPEKYSTYIKNCIKLIGDRTIKLTKKC